MGLETENFPPFGQGWGGGAGSAELGLVWKQLLPHSPGRVVGAEAASPQPELSNKGDPQPSADFCEARQVTEEGPQLTAALGRAEEMPPL